MSPYFASIDLLQVRRRRPLGHTRRAAVDGQLSADVAVPPQLGRAADAVDQISDRPGEDL